MNMPGADIQTLTVKDKDIVVLRMQGMVDATTFANLTAYARKALPDHRVIIIDSNIELFVAPGKEQMDRIERLLNTLVDALADEDEDEPEQDLDGNVVGGERDQSQGL